MLYFSLYGVLAILISPWVDAVYMETWSGELTGGLEIERCQELEIGD
jgi:hypothetical protein